MRNWRVLAALVAMVSAPFAMAEDIPGWTRQSDETGTIYSHPTGPALVVRATFPKTDSSTEQDVVASLSNDLADLGYCPAIAPPSMARVQNDSMTMGFSQGQFTCLVFAMDMGDRFETAVAVEPSADGFGAAEEAARLLKDIRLSSGVRPQTPAPKAPVTTGAAETGTSDRLSAALDAVPVASRPIAIVPRMQYGMDVTIAPWMIFANGYATDGDCYGWDPASTVPTPAALSGRPHTCSVERWRKVGRLYQFQDEDGDWSDGDDFGVLQPFPRGDMLDADLTSLSSYGNEAYVPGNIAIGSVTSGALKMRSSGDIEVGSWTAVSVSGDTLGGGASAERSIRGKYLLDGYLIAIADEAGGISRGFIARHTEDGRFYIYLNGTQYYPANG